jgi:hypothetical protein
MFNREGGAKRTVMYIPEARKRLDLETVIGQQASSPIKNQDALQLGFVLYHACCDGYIVVETKSHVFVRLGVVPRRPHNRKAVAYLLTMNTKQDSRSIAGE